MAQSFDLYALPLYRRDGQDLAYLPGFHAAEAPRRAARGRGGECLLLLLDIQGDLELNRSQMDKLLQDMADGYFGTSGSATSALRAQAERLNTFILEHNQNHPASEPARALLSMAVLREERVLLAQSGPVHGFLLDGPRIQHFYDPPGAGRGLGLGRSTDIRFFQTELPLGAVVMVLPQVPSGWNENTLVGVHGQNLASLRRRFLSQAGTDLAAALLASQPGKGAFHVLVGPQALEELEAKEAEAQPEEAAQPPTTPAPPPEHVAATEPPSAPSPGPSKDQPQESVDPPLGEEDAIETPNHQPPGGVEEPEIVAWSDGDEEPAPVAEWLGILGRRVSTFLGRRVPAMRGFLLRLLPEESSLNLPSSTMAIIAVVVPVIVVVIVSLVYLQVGRGQLLTNYMEQAQSAAAAAEARSDPAEVRQAWELALYYAERAETYQEGEEATTLRLQAQAALDEMDGIQRLDFQLALFDPLPEEANIKRMVATNTDLYMLNSTDGSVLRAFLTGGGYQIDQDFRCSPGPYGGYIVGNLIDVALLPRENPQGADVVAMDANGNLIYCIQGSSPQAVPLVPPASQWGSPLAIAVENGNLYVLDPLTNAVWLYAGDEYSFVEEPRFFFAEEVPSLSDAIDISVQENQLYVLDLESQIALCAYSDDLEDPTTCEDPLEYTDTRAGRSNGDTIEGAHFLQLQVTAPPEPSAFMIDPIAQSVYQFSLRLNLIRQYRSGSELPGEVATAFAVSPNRALFIAFENQIYIGFLP